MTKSRIKQIIYFILNFISIVFLPKKRAVILLYHYIDDSGLYLSVSSKDFKKQMQYLRQYGYNVISLEKLYSIIIKKKEIPKKTVVLTFDDGLKSQFKNAWPVLKKYNLPATFFASPHLLGKRLNNMEDKPQEVMGEEELLELSKSELIDIEPHAMTHRELTSLSLDEAKKEIIDSKKDLERLLNKKCEFFAYPRGAFNSEIINILRKENFKSAVSVKEGVAGRNSNLFKLPRNTIHGQMTEIEFIGKLNYFCAIFNFFRNLLCSKSYH
ncbi:hypothetical protein COV49_04340 [Candidatus Falkowbacteria bacterium CG11_big_fil_rev_8_21_14_0_20_39_10]|uniref:NodB homology domain-containing protein n=1 Tax=Candidatus Falkowbacteria bacterium CG11_big_fil_rev_8_21_14_0_20_39_10 TaxID=1974570 RepID=A0A2M6K7V7_9BACT|nr:MAG: hypothetical protein COV49_04340 [Candidatus Falkowbacteria bacterium CG11_big_fil_rev_8_21_14_0_20_39_10]